jgi:Protein kinase domain
MASQHPSDETLGAFRSGQLDNRSALAVTEHLEQCSECRKRAGATSSDSFLSLVRRAMNAAQPLQAGPTLAGKSKIAPAPPPVDSLPPGLANHRDYEIRKELGRGGMGVVYLAHNTLLGRDEVLKVMGRQIMDRPGVLDRFHREIRAVARLRHANIVSAYSAFRLDESIVFAMEYVDGLDLSKMIKAKGPLPVAHASMFAYQTALGLQHAYEEGLVHRDIKPGNLMLARKGDKATVKILDFGLARATRDETVDSSLTADGQILGTPDFIAPEQITDARSVDIRADIYSLGGTLYYLLMGRPPFLARSFHEICQAHIARTADPLNFVRPDVPVELAAIVARMMAKDPARRPQTPGEVAEALAPLFKTAKAVDASPKVAISGAGAVFEKTHQEPGAANLANVAGSAGETSVAESRWESLVDCREEDGPRDPIAAGEIGRRTPRKTWPIIMAVSLLGLVALAVGVVFTTRDQQRSQDRSIALVDGRAKDVPVPSLDVEPGVGNGPIEPGAGRATAADSSPVAAAAPDPPRADIASDVNARLPSTAATASTTDTAVSAFNSLKVATNLVFSDDFNDAGSKWPTGSTHGYSDGVYFVNSAKNWVHWTCPGKPQTDSIFEVVGRLKSDEPVTKGSWGVTVSTPVSTGARRGFLVKINGMGELFLMPHPSERANEFRAVDPTIGPIVHPAIKPGDQWNTLTLAMKKRTLEIYVNGARVCGPLKLDYDLAPAWIMLGAFDGPTMFRAEFDHVEIREFADNKPQVALVSDESIKRATHSVFIDDFHDSGSGWQRGGGKDYGSGIYFVDSGNGHSYWRAPRHIRMDSALSVTGRMNGPGSANKGTWGVVVGQSAGPSHLGFMVKINGKGELFLGPSPATAKDFLKIVPSLGPIVHPAIKPGEQSNALTLVMKKRILEIYVNAVRVCEPVTFAFDLTPSHFSLAAWDDSGFRSEFEKVEIREFWDDKPRLSPTAFRSIASATRPAYIDEFSDHRSGWARGQRYGYSSGIYFVVPLDGVSVHKSPVGLRADSAVEVVGRLKTADSSIRGAWAVIVNREIGAATRGFLVKINGKGELFLTPNPWNAAKDFVDVDPRIGPIVNPAIKPVNQVNRVVLLVRKRSLEIFVNSVRVCDPVPYDFDLTPSFVQLGAWDGPGDFRAEFDSMSIRSFIRP